MVIAALRQPNVTRPGSPILQFLGAARTVTGSRFLVSTGASNVLIDCGLYQGERELRERNWADFPVPPGELDAVVLTHAHVDHCGYLPALVVAGFHGSVFVTPGTEALVNIVLPDSGHLQEEEAEYASQHGFSRHHPPQPLYTEKDARACLAQLRAVEFNERTEIATGVHLTFQRAGHILGAASAHLELENGETIVFSGDLGRSQHPLLLPPASIGAADTVVVESTYGNRSHGNGDPVEAMADAIRRTAARGGTVIIPSFAVDRTEVLLFHLRQLMADERVPSLPVYVDSPMALSALAVYREAIANRSSELRPEVLAGHRDPFDTGTLTEVRDVEESKKLHGNRFPSIIISASGMATGGRVLHHLANRLPDNRNTILLAGFQAAGTRGRRLADGERQIKLLGRYVPVKAEIANLPALSVHADRDEIVQWLGTATREPFTTFVVHGESEACESLRDAIETELEWTAVVPDYLERVRLD
jgi:metallo-beta-lactamase family protein